MVSAVIFDVDGTLLDTEKIYMKAWQVAGKAIGYDVPWEALLRTRAINKAAAKRIFQEYLGEAFPYDELFDSRVEISERLIHEDKDLLKPGVADTLQKLMEMGIPMAVASSTGKEKTAEHLEHAGILHYFAAVVGGDMVQNGKPAPDIFLLAAKKLGISPESCAVIEDSPAGIQAAHAGGMKPILIPDCVPAKPESIAVSSAVLSSMEQLLPALEML